MRHSTAAVLLIAITAAGVVTIANRTTAAQGQGTTLQPDFVTAAVRHARSTRRLGDIPKKGQVGPKRENHVRPIPVPAGASSQDSSVQSVATAGLAIAQGPGFDGIGEQWDQSPYNVQYSPSDINGAAGVTQYVQWVNTSFAVFRKSDGLLLAGPTLGNTLWDGFGGNCETENDGDPIVQFDKAASRWVMTQFQVSALPYSQCVAVSETEDATGNYFLYEFTYDDFPDYPKLGVWPNAYLITFNMFSSRFLGPLACAYDRDRMLQGLSASQVCFQLTNQQAGALLPGDLDGATPPPANSPAFFVGKASNALHLWRMSLDWASPGSATLTGPTSIAVPAYTTACGGGACIPQPNTNQVLDSLADRVMYRLAYRNFGTHQSLVVNQAVAANGVTGIRWYEVRNPQGTPQLFQASTYAPDSLYRWMGSAAMDKFGNLAIGYSVSSASTFPSIRLAGREATAPLSTLTLETTIIDGAGSQTGLSRWGDYTSISVDPVDDCTFWYTNQYLKSTGSFNWSTRVAWFKFDSCDGAAPTPDFSVAATPSSRTVTAGGATSYTVTASQLGGFDGTVTLTAEGLPAGATMTFNPADFTGGSGTSSAGVTTEATLAPSTYNFTVKGTSGALTHSTPLSLVVNPPVIPDFSIAVSPSTRNIKAGQVTKFTVTITRTNGFTGPIGFSVTALPPNTTAGFSPDPTTGNSSTLSVDTAPNTPKNAYPLTIQAVGGGLTRTATITLQVR